MIKIKKLNEKVINQIAAGEVVERPASVVKELVENALDAGAGWIDVEIEGGGLKLIKVSDDGDGMGKEDARLAVEKHATSKIESIQDLSNIGTFGFRGEALASMASVSHFEINTRQKGNLSGTQIRVRGGGELKVSESGRPEGTTMTVSNLFFNTPARLKFMKKQSTEENHIVLVMNTYALACPSVGFKLSIEGKPVLNAAQGDFKTRLIQVFGKDTASHLTPLNYQAGDIKITGVISTPAISKPTRENMLYFVNRRWIMNPSLGHAVMTGFHTLLPTRRFPVSALFIEMPSSQVDVNVHPTKREVKFAKDREVYDAIVWAVRNAVLEADPKSGPSTAYISSNAPQPYSVLRADEAQPAQSLWAPMSTAPDAPSHTKDYAPSEINLGHSYVPKEDFSKSNFQARKIDPQIPLYHFSQLFNTFIVFQSDEEMFIADQHTVHERLNYEKLMRGLSEKALEIQPLLIPVTVELSAKEAHWLRDKLDLLMELGMEVAAFGGNTFVIRTVLADLAGKNLANLLRELIEDLSKKEADGTGGPNRIDQIRERSLTFLSCRSAVMAGDRLNEEQMVVLIERMRSANLPFTCPHGRPTILSIPLSELYKKFDRH